MTKLNLDIDTWHNNDGEDSNEPYSYRGTTSGQVRGVYVSANEYEYGYRGFETDIDDPQYVLYAEYYTGDTFGSDYEACIVGVNNDHDELVALREEAEKFEGFGELSNGFYVPWTGYFERLIALTIDTVQTRRDRKTY